MKNKHIILASYKIGFALLGLSAVATEIIVLSQRGVFDAANFFSFFTILSNVFAAFVLMVSAIYVVRRSKSKRLDSFRGAATLYMVLTGVVFAVLLSGLDPRLLTAVPWDNTVLHYILPVILLIDWLIDPPRARISTRSVLLWLAFPQLYVAYSLLRGPIVGWYPYPFLNPANGGYDAILLVCVVITIFAVIAGFLLKNVSSHLQMTYDE